MLRQPPPFAARPRGPTPTYPEPGRQSGHPKHLHAKAICGVAHPRRQLTGTAGALFQPNDRMAAADRPVHHPEFAIKKRVPGIRDPRRLVSVCGMSFDPPFAFKFFLSRL